MLPLKHSEKSRPSSSDKWKKQNTLTYRYLPMSNPSESIVDYGIQRKQHRSGDWIVQVRRTTRRRGSSTSEHTEVSDDLKVWQEIRKEDLSPKYSTRESADAAFDALEARLRSLGFVDRAT